MKRLLDFSELVALNAIPGGSDLSISDYIQKINQYMTFNFKMMLLKFDETDFFEYRMKLINQKRSLIILYNLMTRNQDLKNRLISLIDIYMVAVDNFNDLCYNAGEDSNFIRVVVLWLGNQFKVQLANVNLANKQQYFDKINGVIKNVFQADVVQNNDTAIKIQQTRTATQSLTVIKFDASSQ